MPGRLLTLLRFALCVCVVVATAAGCTLMRKSMDIDYDDQRLNGGLQSVLDTGQRARLSDFTSWEWDEVHLFNEHAPRDYIEEVVGAPVIKADHYDSKASLLIFENEGRPVKAAGVSGDYLRRDDRRVSWPADVLVAPQGTGFLLLTLDTVRA